jgi:hypothetical protein
MNLADYCCERIECAVREGVDLVFRQRVQFEERLPDACAAVAIAAHDSTRCRRSVELRLGGR